MVKLSNDNLEDVFPMSDNSQGIIFHSINEPNRILYHDQKIVQFKIDGFKTEILKNTINLMVNKHQNLRSCFNLVDFETPVQIVLKEVEMDIEILDLFVESLEERISFLKEVLVADSCKPFNFYDLKPLWRIKLINFGADNYILIWISHHSIMDGWSTASLLTEINFVYNELHKNPDYQPKRLNGSYKHYVLDQLIEKKNIKAINYWENEFENFNTFHLPFEMAEPNANNHREIFYYNLEESLKDSILCFVKENSSTIHNLCFAAYVILLYVITAKDDITIGLAVNNRPLIEDGDKILGCCVGHVPVRIKINRHLSLKETIKQIDNKLLELRKFGRLSLFEIKRIAQRVSSCKEVFNQVFQLTNFHIYNKLDSQPLVGVPFNEKISTQTNRLNEIASDNSSSLTYTVNTTLNSFQLCVEFNHAIISRLNVIKICEMYRNLLEKICKGDSNLVELEEFFENNSFGPLDNEKKTSKNASITFNL